MVNIATNNWFGVMPGQPAFNILSNFCNYFEIGRREGEDVWLEGQIVQGEFLFNGRLYLPSGELGTVIDNFPKSPAPKGWKQRRRLDAVGYELLDQNDERLFAYHIEGPVCVVDVNLTRSNGELAAHPGQGGIALHVPAVLGRPGMVLG